MPRGKLASSLRGADAHHRREPSSAALELSRSAPEGLLKRKALDECLELRPAVETEPARELELHLRQLPIVPCRASLPQALFRLLGQLLEIEPKHPRLPSATPGARRSGWRGVVLGLLKRGWGRPFLADWTRPSPHPGVERSSKIEGDPSPSMKLVGHRRAIRASRRGRNLTLPSARRGLEAGSRQRGRHGPVDDRMEHAPAIKKRAGADLHRKHRRKVPRTLNPKPVPLQA